MTLYPMWLWIMWAWMSVEYLVNLGQTVAELFDSLAGLIRLRITFVLYLTAFCSRPKATSDVIFGRFVGPVILDNHMRFGDRCIKFSREIPHEAA